MTLLKNAVPSPRTPSNHHQTLSTHPLAPLVEVEVAQVVELLGVVVLVLQPLLVLPGQHPGVAPGVPELTLLRVLQRRLADALSTEEGGRRGRLHAYRRRCLG